MVNYIRKFIIFQDKASLREFIHLKANNSYQTILKATGCCNSRHRKGIGDQEQYHSRLKTQGKQSVNFGNCGEGKRKKKSMPFQLNMEVSGIADDKPCDKRKQLSQRGSPKC